MFSGNGGSELKGEGSESALWYKDWECNRRMQYWHTRGKFRMKEFCKAYSDKLEDASQSGGLEQSATMRRC